jgi:hypothetical protein
MHYGIALCYLNWRAVPLVAACMPFLLWYDTLAGAYNQLRGVTYRALFSCISCRSPAFI